MSKLVLYMGKCKSIISNGVKFTTDVKSHVVSDEVGATFKGLDDFKVVDIKKEEIVQDVDPEKELRKRLGSLKVEQLRDMCELKGLDSTGRKDELIDKLVEESKKDDNSGKEQE